MHFRSRSILLAASLLFTSLPAHSKPLCRMVGDTWVWFSDHAVASITYGIAVQDGFKVRAATGPSVFGNPIGSRHEFEGSDEVTAFGVGAIHIKRIGGNGEAKVCVDQTGMSLVSLSTFLRQALPEDF